MDDRGLLLQGSCLELFQGCQLPFSSNLDNKAMQLATTRNVIKHDLFDLLIAL
jgi:hypothetical protein